MPGFAHFAAFAHLKVHRDLAGWPAHRMDGTDFANLDFGPGAHAILDDGYHRIINAARLDVSDPAIPHET